MSHANETRTQQARPTRLALPRVLAAALAWSACLLAAAVAAEPAGDAKSPRPDTSRPDAATRPVAATTLPDGRSAPPVSLEAEPLEFLPLVGDNATLYDSGYYTLRDMPPQLNADKVKTVTVDQLKNHPADFVGKAVRTNVQFGMLYLPDDDPESAGHKAFAIMAYVGSVNSPKPVVVLSPSVPPKMKRFERFEVLGYFYKVLPLRRGEGKIDVPVIVSYQINPMGQPVAQTDSGPSLGYWGILVVLAVMVVAWILVRTRLARPTAAGGQPVGGAGGEYKPLRYQMTPEEIERSKVNLAPPEFPTDSADSTDSTDTSKPG